jgi:hypothetical protein
VSDILDTPIGQVEIVKAVGYNSPEEIMDAITRAWDSSEEEEELPAWIDPNLPFTPQNMGATMMNWLKHEFSPYLDLHNQWMSPEAYAEFHERCISVFTETSISRGDFDLALASMLEEGKLEVVPGTDPVKYRLPELELRNIPNRDPPGWCEEEEEGVPELVSDDELPTNSDDFADLPELVAPSVRECSCVSRLDFATHHKEGEQSPHEEPPAEVLAQIKQPAPLQPTPEQIALWGHRHGPLYDA